MSAIDLLGALVLEDGRRWGEAAADFQRADAEAVLDLSGPRLHLITRARGGSKTSDIAGVAIAVLLDQAPTRSRSYALAADRDQGALLVDAMAGYIARTEGLSSQLKVEAYRVVAVRSGATLEVLAADEASSWGLLPYFVAVDELAQWKSTAEPRRLWSAIFSSLPKRPDSRLCAITSAGDPGHWSHGVLESAQSRPERWRVSETPGPVPWISFADLEEQRATLTATEYQRLHLNVWTAPEDRLTTLDDVRRCIGHEGVLAPEPGRVYAAGLDLGLKRDRTVLSVCHLETVPGAEGEPDANVVVLDRQEVWTPTGGVHVPLAEVEAVVFEAWRAYRCPVWVDPWQAAQLGQNLRRRGVRMSDFTFSQQAIGRLAVTLYRLLRDHLLDLPNDPELIDELATVRLVERSPGTWRIDDGGDGRHDDRVISLGLAAHHLLTQSGRRRARVVVRNTFSA